MDNPVEIATDLIKKHEGLELHPYMDTVGKLTIGYGRNLSDRGITRAEADYLLTTDIVQAHADAEDLAGDVWHHFSVRRQAVLIDMSFNLGKGRLKQFRKMWQALYRCDYDTAAKEMLNSRWAFQVGQRAINLAEIMRNG